MQETQKKRDDSEIISSTKEDGNVMDVQVHDSSLDYKGRIPLRTSTGSWKASFFILAIEFSEILCYFGISTNMIAYMTKVMHQDLKTAANSVNLWIGVTAVSPLVGGFVADAYVGKFYVILFSAILYVMGLGLFTMTQFVPSLKPCKTTLNTCDHVSNVHKVVFFIAAYLLAIATGGYKPCLESFGADQFDDNHPKERKQKVSFFNYWNIAVGSGIFFGVTVLVYMQEKVSWGIVFSILATTISASALIFVLGRPFYRYRTTHGSPLTPLLQVLVAATLNRNLPCPSPSFLHELQKEEKLGKRLLGHTNRLRFLDKAAIINHEGDVATTTKQSPWRLATVTQVEELKLMIAMTPMWLTSLMFGVGNSIGPTFFVKQGFAMNRNLFKHFEIPAASMGLLTALGMIASATFFDKVLVPCLRKATGNERGINILTRIGIGMLILILSMIISALVERQRLKELFQGNTMHIFWLAPQILIMGIGDGYSLIGLQEYFYEQVPDSMRSLGIAFYLSITGVGSFFTSFLITVVDYVTRMHNGKGWIGKDVNHSRLDLFYWLLMFIFALNMCAYMLIAKNYRYKNVQPSVASGDSCGGEKGEKVANV